KFGAVKHHLKFKLKIRSRFSGGLSGELNYA
ncbi:MAG: hypothetical protein ACI854_000799, partial [Arenicella sp.]